MSTIARFSVAEYDRIVNTGALERRRLELIRGGIREMGPIGPHHEHAVDVLTRWSAESVSNEQARIRVQHSIGLAELESVPQPDIAWVSPGSYGEQRPQTADALLIIEVSDTSRAYDRGEKMLMFAEAEIADYWIINLRDKVIEVHRDPQTDRYRDVTVYRGNDEVRPLAFPDVVLRPVTLWE